MTDTNLLVIFITGLTAGGLSCLAVQAGLLTTAIADQAAEDIAGDLQEAATKPKSRPQHPRGSEFVQQLELLQKRRLPKRQFAHALQLLKQRYPALYAPADVTEQTVSETATEKKYHPLKPIVLFLSSRLAAFTLLGFALGWLGSVLQLTPYMQAAVQIAVAIFMLGTAGRMLNIHPIFRYFAIEPPKKVRRYLRSKAKNGDGHVFTPLLLGALTVLIPCGITQVMMAAAIASGNPISGGLILFAFILGTSPIFFAVAYAATKLGERLQKGFLKAVAIVLIVLGLITLEGGLNLTGSPVSFAAAKQSVGNFISNIGDEAPATEERMSGTLTLTASSYSYSPAVIKAEAYKPYTLKINSEDNAGCGRAFYIPSLNIKKTLPENGTTTIDLPPQPAGTLRMTCSMGMYRAEIEFN